MAKILKENSPPMQAINAVEKILTDAGIVLNVQSNTIFMTVNGKQFRLKDLEGSSSTQLPRFTDSERFVLDD